MKNITVTVDDEIYHEARVLAAEKRTTVTALVREFLTRLVREEPRFERLEREQGDLIARIRDAHPGFRSGDRVARDALYDRRALP